jgi:hypothetical protein
MVAIGDNRTAAAEMPGRRDSFRLADPTKMGFFWLSAFFVVYCARPEDWVPGLKYLPCAKITAILAMWGMFTALGRTKRTFKDAPVEAKLLLVMILILFLSAFTSPIWIGGAVNHTIDFAKVWVAWMLTFLLITTFDRLRQIIQIQTASVAVICAISIIKGHNQPRLEGVIGGIYSNPNDLAFAVVLTVPFALAFMLTSKNVLKKLWWVIAILIMMAALVLTASRGGFVNLVITGCVMLWHFGIKGKRPGLIAGVVLASVLLLVVAGGKLSARFEALSGDNKSEQSAYGSYRDRMYLMRRAVEGIVTHPLLGIGDNNFMTYSLNWHEVHMTYLQIAVEGGIPCMILYIMFFRRGFKNLKTMRKASNLDEHTVLFVGALHSSLVGFAVGACFAPEAYQFFPYFAVAFTSTLLQTLKERELEPTAPPSGPKRPRHFLELADDYRNASAVPHYR